MESWSINTTCDAPDCGTFATYGPFAIDLRMPEGYVPDGWLVVGEKYYCFRHKIEVVVKIDNKEVTS